MTLKKREFTPESGSVDTYVIFLLSREIITYLNSKRLNFTSLSTEIKIKFWYVLHVPLFPRSQFVFRITCK